MTENPSCLTITSGEIIPSLSSEFPQSSSAVLTNVRRAAKLGVPPSGIRTQMILDRIQHTVAGLRFDISDLLVDCIQEFPDIESVLGFVRQCCCVCFEGLA